MSYGGKFSVITQICWEWTQYEGKYNGCRLWSNKAINQYQGRLNDVPQSKATYS